MSLFTKGHHCTSLDKYYCSATFWHCCSCSLGHKMSSSSRLWSSPVIDRQFDTECSILVCHSGCENVPHPGDVAHKGARVLAGTGKSLSPLSRKLATLCRAVILWEAFGARCLMEPSNRSSRSTSTPRILMVSWGGRGTPSKHICPSTGGLAAGNWEIIIACVFSGAKVTCQQVPHSRITQSCWLISPAASPLSCRG